MNHFTEDLGSPNEDYSTFLAAPQVKQLRHDDPQAYEIYRRCLQVNCSYRSARGIEGVCVMRTLGATERDIKYLTSHGYLWAWEDDTQFQIFRFTPEGSQLAKDEYLRLYGMFRKRNARRRLRMEKPTENEIHDGTRLGAHERSRKVVRELTMPHAEGVKTWTLTMLREWAHLERLSPRLRKNGKPRRSRLPQISEDNSTIGRRASSENVYNVSQGLEQRKEPKESNITSYITTTPLYSPQTAETRNRRQSQNRGYEAHQVKTIQRIAQNAWRMACERLKASEIGKSKLFAIFEKLTMRRSPIIEFLKRGGLDWEWFDWAEFLMNFIRKALSNKRLTATAVSIMRYLKAFVKWERKPREDGAKTARNGRKLSENDFEARDLKAVRQEAAMNGFNDAQDADSDQLIAETARVLKQQRHDGQKADMAAAKQAAVAKVGYAHALQQLTEQLCAKYAISARYFTTNRDAYTEYEQKIRELKSRYSSLTASSMIS